MSSVVGFDIFDLDELSEFIEEIAIVPNLDLTAGTQVEMTLDGIGDGAGTTVNFTLSGDTPAGQAIIVDVQTGENRSFGEHGVNDAWSRIDTSLISVELIEPLSETDATGTGSAAIDVSINAPVMLDDAAADAGVQIVFVDANAENVQQLIDGLDAAYEVHIIDAGKNGVAFMASVLEGRSGIDAVHVISHGQPGQLQLGNATVDAAGILGSQADLWSAIGDSLADAGDLLIYGCNFGEGRIGSLTVDALAHATGADVSASDDDTGAAGLGGDWDLEVSTGAVEAQSIAVEEFDGLLELVQSEVVVPPSNQANTLAQNIFGTGVTINSASYTGAASQAATFSGALDGAGSTFLGFDSGVIFSTGNANGIVGTTAAGNFGTDINDPGATDDDPDFNSLEDGISTFDASFLEANITSTTGVLTLQFVFGSDEYNEFVYAGFNDSIGIWINGVNYAVTTDGQQVGIDTINSAGTINPTSTQSADSKDPNSTHDPTDGIYESANQSLHVTRTTEPTQMDGYTTTISVNINLEIGVATDIKIGIADTGDAVYDSWLIVRENSFQSVLAAFEDQVVTTPNTSVTISPLNNDFSDTHTVADLAITKINGVTVVDGQTVVLPTGVSVTLDATNNTLLVNPNGNAISHDTFTYEVTDPSGQTAVGLVGMNTNGAPLLNLDPDNSGGGLDNRGFDAYFDPVSGASVNIADADVDITDLNSPNLTSMNINVSGVVDGNSEVLNIGGTNFALATTAAGTVVTVGGTDFVVAYDISGTPDVFSITVQGGGTALQADWEALIASITYDNTSGFATLGNREFDIIVNDGTTNSNVGEAIVHVAAPDAVIAGTDTGSVTEDSSPFTLTTGGTLTITDPDNGEAQFVEGTYGGIYGSVSINPLGGWTYSVSNTDPVIDGLGAGDTLTDTITVTSVDGTTHDIVITVNGVDDAPVIGGDTSGAVTEDDAATLTATGALTIADPDAGESVFNAGTVNGTYGDLVIAANGSWTYSADNSQAAIQSLAGGDTLTEVITVTSADGTTQNITITINGLYETLIATDDDYASDEDTAISITAPAGVLSNDNVVDTGVYNFTGAGGGTSGSFEGLTGNPTDSSASFEILFRPADTNDHDMLFETGGTVDGMAISIDGTTLNFQVRDNTTNISTASIDLVTLGITDPTEQFVHVTGVFTIDGQLQLYVNGTLAQTVSGVGLFDWAGSDGAGLGRVNGSSTMAGAGNFEGDIALFRFYERALSGTDVAQNYASLDSGNGVAAISGATLTYDFASDPNPNDGVLPGGASSFTLDASVTSADGLSVSEIEGSAADVGSSVTLASGALVTLNADGSFNYDPNGQFEALADGESATDTFDYTITDAFGQTDTATATITIAGVNDDPTYTVAGTLSVQENVSDGGTIGSAFDPTGTVVGTLTPVDVDTTDTHTFTIVNALGISVTDANFEIVGDEIRVKAGNTLDFETATSHTVRILVDDGNGGTFVQTVTVNVTNYEGTVSDGAGDDTYVGTSEEDTFIGDDGLNYFIGGAGADTIDGTVGHCDYASYTTATSGVVVDLNLATQAASSGDATGDVLIGIENLFGSAFADELTGNNLNNYLRGGDGNDTLVGNGGNDHLEGGLGADVLDGGDGSDYVRYHRAASGVTVDLVNGGSGGEALGDSYIDVESVQGSAFADVLIGNDEYNVLLGGAGNDRLVGAGGSDTLIGQDGIDTFVFALADSGVDRIYQFTSGSDLLEFEAADLGGSIGTGALNASELTFGAAASGANAQFIYNSADGILSFDADGDGAGLAQAIVQLTGAPALSVNDFDIV